MYKKISIDNFNFGFIELLIDRWSHKEKAEFAVGCADLVSHICCGDDAVVADISIDSAKSWLESQSDNDLCKCESLSKTALAECKATTRRSRLAVTSAVSACSCVINDQLSTKKAIKSALYAYYAYINSYGILNEIEDYSYSSIKMGIIGVIEKIDGKRNKMDKYVKCEFEFAWQAVKEFEDFHCAINGAERLYTKVSHETFAEIREASDAIKYQYRLYRKVKINSL